MCFSEEPRLMESMAFYSYSPRVVSSSSSRCVSFVLVFVFGWPFEPFSILKGAQNEASFTVEFSSRITQAKFALSGQEARIKLVKVCSLSPAT